MKKKKKLNDDSDKKNNIYRANGNIYQQNDINPYLNDNIYNQGSNYYNSNNMNSYSNNENKNYNPNGMNPYSSNGNNYYNQGSNNYNSNMNSYSNNGNNYYGQQGYNYIPDSGNYNPTGRIREVETEKSSKKDDVKKLLKKVAIYFIISLLILTIGFGLFYLLKEKKTFTITFDSNGAFLQADSLSCQTKFKKCKIVLPKIKRDDYEVLGYSMNPSSTTVDYKDNETITIEKDMTLYAITKKTITVTFDSNGADYIEYNEKSCDIYNEDSSCKVRIPYFNRKGYISFGFSEDKNSKDKQPNYVSNSEITVSANKVLYTFWGEAISKRIIEVSNSSKVGNLFVEQDKKCSGTDYIKTITDINSNWPFLFTYPKYGKISIVSKGTFDNFYNRPSSGTVGITFANEKQPQIGFVDLKCGVGEFVAVHELLHKSDFEYLALNGTELSSNQDFSDLYKKYCTSGKGLFRNYTCANKFEFLSEIFAYYYVKFVSKSNDGPKSFTTTYPSDVKNVVEKYIDYLTEESKKS